MQKQKLTKRDLREFLIGQLTAHLSKLIFFRRDKVDLEVFREVLYTESSHKVSFQTLKMTDSKMTRVETMKESGYRNHISI